jgi:ribosomal protein S18 acetylase RimI-like enzyme
MTHQSLHYSIVPLTEATIPGFHTLLDAVAHERQFIDFVAAPALAGTREFVLANIRAGAVLLVAVSKRRVVGWCDIAIRQFEGFTHSGYLGIGVHKGLRRQGIGTALLSRALEEAYINGLERIDLEVYTANTAAINLYLKFGFHVEGRREGGRFEEVTIMAKQL